MNSLLLNAKPIFQFIIGSHFYLHGFHIMTMIFVLIDNFLLMSVHIAHYSRPISLELEAI